MYTPSGPSWRVIGWKVALFVFYFLLLGWRRNFRYYWLCRRYTDVSVCLSVCHSNPSQILQTQPQFVRRIRKIAKNDNWLRHVCPSVSSSACPHETTRLLLDGFQWSLVFECFSKIYLKSSIFLEPAKCDGTVYDDQYTFVIISRSFHLRMRNVSDQSCRETGNTHFVFNNFFFLNHAVYEIMWKNTVERDRPQMTVCRKRIACRIPKATNTHTICVMLIASPHQQWLYERATMFRYTYSFCLVLAWRHLSALTDNHQATITASVNVRLHTCKLQFTLWDPTCERWLVDIKLC